MTDWVRLWHDMPTDPKWRTIARKSKQRVGDVIAVFNFVMVNASANSAERGTLAGFDIEDVATALDIAEEDVSAILAAMQGKVLDGERLTGWEKRQPKREDGTASERKAAWKERQRNAAERIGTHGNAPETDTETERDIPLANANGAQSDFLKPEAPPDPDRAFWITAKAYLAGAGVRNPGNVIGKFIREHGKDATASALTKAQLERAVDPVPFMQGCFRKYKPEQPKVPL